MTHHEKVLLIAALLLAHGSAVEAVPVSPVTLTTSSLSSSSFAATLLGAPFNVGGSAGNYDLSFTTPIADASELTSISGGSVSTGEGGSFQLSVRYTSGTWTQLLSQGFDFRGGSYSFSNLSPTSFTPGTIDAIRFALGNEYQYLSLPQNTQFTFAVTPPAITPAVPEPSSVMLMLAGGAAGLLSLRRRRKSAVPQLATSE